MEPQMTQIWVVVNVMSCCSGTKRPLMGHPRCGARVARFVETSRLTTFNHDR